MQEVKTNKPGESYKECIALKSCRECRKPCEEYKSWLKQNKGK